VLAFAALADPVRVEIVELLAGGERSAGAIAARFPVSGPAVSRHLRVLRQAGIVRCRAEAQKRIYSLNPEPIAELEGWSAELLSEWRSRFEALGQYLDEAATKNGGEA
jgi:DNA-binding transcriptional ArsR family regulator